MINDLRPKPRDRATRMAGSSTKASSASRPASEVLEDLTDPRTARRNQEPHKLPLAISASATASAGRAAPLAPVVRENSSRSPTTCHCRSRKTAAPSFVPESWTEHVLHEVDGRTFTTGASAASCGGAIKYPPGSISRPARSSKMASIDFDQGGAGCLAHQAYRRRANGFKTPTCSIPGLALGCGRFRRLGWPREDRRTEEPSTPTR